jgi:hypothetical protein
MLWVTITIVYRGRLGNGFGFWNTIPIRRLTVIGDTPGPGRLRPGGRGERPGLHGVLFWLVHVIPHKRLPMSRFLRADKNKR